jgi:hypothetical protein
MKKVFIFLGILMLSSAVFSCKKKVEKKAEDYIIEIMTNGRWYMHNYKEQGIDHTYEFDGYEFQFYADGKVEGILNNMAKTGTWKGDITNYTITAEFPSAGEPLSKLNNTWKITDSYINAVFAQANFGASLNQIQLVKK